MQKNSAKIYAFLKEYNESIMSRQAKLLAAMELQADGRY